LTFCDFSVAINAAEEPENKCNESFRAAEKVVKGLFEIDPYIKIFQNSAEDRAENDDMIDSMAAWTEMMSDKNIMYLRRFMQGAKVLFNNAAGMMHIQMLIGSYKKMEDIGACCAAKGFKYYVKKLQVENSVCIGWLYRTHGAIDREKFEEETVKILEFPVAIKWRQIWGGKLKGSLGKDFYAYHVEVNEDTQAHDTLKVKELFHAAREQGEGLPLCIECRFIEHYDFVKGDDDQFKVRKMWGKQAAYCRRIRPLESKVFRDVDTPLQGLGGHTIRHFMMDLMSEEDETLPLFLGINRKFGKRNKEWWVHAPPQCEVESDEVLKGILPLLQYEIGRHHPFETAVVFISELEEQFTNDSVDTSREVRWDPILRCAISMESEDLDARCNNPRDVKFDFSAMEKDLEEIIEKSFPNKRTPSPDDISVGVDTVGTIGNPAQKRRDLPRSGSKEAKWEAIIKNSRIAMDQDDDLQDDEDDPDQNGEYQQNDDQQQSGFEGPSPMGGDGQGL
jgi:hypothetical protein